MLMASDTFTINLQLSRAYNARLSAVLWACGILARGIGLLPTRYRRQLTEPLYALACWLVSNPGVKVIRG
jgi:hypothetical protein